MINLIGNNNYTLEPISYYMKEFDDSFAMWVHSHDYLEIMYTNKGTFNIELYFDENDLNKKETFTISQNSFILLFPNLYHNMIIEKDKKAYVMNIEINPIIENNSFSFIDNKKIFMNTNFKDVLIENRKFLILEDKSQVGTVFKDLLLSLETKDDSQENKLSIETKKANLLLEISKCINKKNIGLYSYLKKANAFILDNYTKDITISDIANYVGISSSYLEHQYKKCIGQTIHNFINTLRTQKAAKLLKEGKEKINNIAIITGFKDKGQLNYQFQKQYGVSPSAYKKQVMNLDVDYTSNVWKAKAFDPNEE